MCVLEVILLDANWGTQMTSSNRIDFHYPPPYVQISTSFLSILINYKEIEIYFLNGGMVAWIFLTENDDWKLRIHNTIDRR